MRYEIFGLTLESDFRFQNHLGIGSGNPDLTFVLNPPGSPPDGWRNSRATYVSQIEGEKGVSVLYFHQQSAYSVLHFPRVADFYLWEDRIECWELGDQYSFMVEIHLLGVVLAMWLELRGVISLHASAVIVDNKTVAFLASNTGGKSSLAASLVQLGHSLLSDDILPVVIQDGAAVGHSGYPQMRMWPDMATHFVGDISNLKHVHPELDKLRVPIGANGFGQFHSNECPISVMYVPELLDRSKHTSIHIRTIPPSEAVFELAKNSFVIHIIEKMNIQKDRFQTVAEIAQLVPMRRLSYPKEISLLPDVVQAVQEDVLML